MSDEKRFELEATLAEELLGHAVEIDSHLGDLQAAILYLRDEFKTPPTRAFAALESALAAIRTETAYMRRRGLEDGVSQLRRDRLSGKHVVLPPGLVDFESRRKARES